MYEKRDLKTLEKALGVTFQDKSLLTQALTHASLTGDVQHNNERLEFLGDRVLGFCIAHLLYQTFPLESEGSLARRQAVLVSKRTLVKVAMALNLSLYLGHARRIKREEGKTNSSLLADSCEALLAALFLDQGIEKCQDLIQRLWLPYINVDSEAPKDARTELQEWTQKKGYPLPLYEVVKVEGKAHSPSFTMKASVHGYAEVIVLGKSKKEAAHKCAEQLYQIISKKDDHET